MQITIDGVIFRESSQRQVIFKFLLVSESAIKFNRNVSFLSYWILPYAKNPSFSENEATSQCKNMWERVSFMLAARQYKCF